MPQAVASSSSDNKTGLIVGLVVGLTLGVVLIVIFLVSASVRGRRTMLMLTRVERFRGWTLSKL